VQAKKRISAGQKTSSKTSVHWGLIDMIESVNHEGGHTTSRPGEHPSSKDVIWHNIWEGTRHNDISVKNARSTMHDHCTPGKFKINYGRGVYLAGIVQVGSFRLR
jgi:hypothetical protein